MYRFQIPIGFLTAGNKKESIIQSFAATLSSKSEAIIQLPVKLVAGEDPVKWPESLNHLQHHPYEAHNSGKNTALQILDMRSP